jgi:hypothetical protein
VAQGQEAGPLHIMEGVGMALHRESTPHQGSTRQLATPRGWRAQGATHTMAGAGAAGGEGRPLVGPLCGACMVGRGHQGVEAGGGAEAGTGTGVTTS